MDATNLQIISIIIGVVGVLIPLSIHLSRVWAKREKKPRLESRERPIAVDDCKDISPDYLKPVPLESTFPDPIHITESGKVGESGVSRTDAGLDWVDDLIPFTTGQTVECEIPPDPTLPQHQPGASPLVTLAGMKKNMDNVQKMFPTVGVSSGFKKAMDEEKDDLKSILKNEQKLFEMTCKEEAELELGGIFHDWNEPWSEEIKPVRQALLDAQIKTIRKKRQEERIADEQKKMLKLHTEAVGRSFMGTGVGALGGAIHTPLGMLVSEGGGGVKLPKIDAQHELDPIFGLGKANPFGFKDRSKTEIEYDLLSQ